MTKNHLVVTEAESAKIRIPHLFLSLKHIHCLRRQKTDSFEWTCMHACTVVPRASVFEQIAVHLRLNLIPSSLNSTNQIDRQCSARQSHVK